MKKYLVHLTVLLVTVATVFLTGGLCHAVSSSVQVSAIIVSKHNCKFNSKAPVALDFGTLDPLSGINVTRTATLVFSCSGNPNNPVSYGVSDDDGLYETGSNGNRMKHLSLSGLDAFIPYSFTISPTSGSTTTKPKTDVPLTITGTVLGSAYNKVYQGDYTDTVTVNINP